MNEQTLAPLKDRIKGQVVLPTSPQYAQLRRGFNHTGSPAVIVQCASDEDVASAIKFARDHTLTLSVRCGGHSFSGLSTNNGGLVIDLSPLSQIEILDPRQHLVRIGGGAKWGAVAAELGTRGLGLSSGDTNSVGVGGLTLGGGIGWLVRKYGLAIDSLEAAQIVTADGRSLRVSATEYPDLFWAIRGGGGNFGVVTSFDFRAHPLITIVGGLATYPVAEMKQVLQGWAAYLRIAPEELNSTLTIMPGFGPQMPPQIMLGICYGGEDEAGANHAIKPLLELGTLQHQTIQKKPYHEMLEDAKPPSADFRATTQDGFIKTLSDDVIAVIAAAYGKPGTPIVQIRSLDGAVARVSPEATAFAHREYEAFIMAASLVPTATTDAEARRISQAAWLPLQPFAHGAYINFQTAVDTASVAAAYPPATYARLATVKAAYDPENLFNQNANIKPAAA
ncbi:MAG TPA: FAD-binding protein [Candidatus Saccharimonadia bacterium]|nr:FAD-binding protein [Candidatus Saccharimonadia bacterium]